MKYLLRLGPVFVLLLVPGVAWLLSSILMFPARMVCNKDLFVYCETPKEMGYEFEDIWVESSHGVNLSGWWIPSQGSSKTIIFSHGHGGDRHEGLRFLKALHDAGFSVIAFDYRGAGTSTGVYDSMGYFERDDLEAVVQYAEKKGSLSIGVLGFSQGGATALLTMAHNSKIKAGVMEGSFSNAKDVIAEAAFSMFYVPGFPLVDLALYIFEQRTGVNFEDLNPSDAIPKIEADRLLLIHAKRDSFVPIHHALKLIESAPRSHQWIYDGDRHAEAWQFDRSKAESLVVEHFKFWLRSKG